MVRLPVLAVILFSLAFLARAEHPRSTLTNDPTLAQPPHWEPADDFNPPSPTVRAIWYDAKPWKSKPTKVFAYLGVPTAAAGTKVPGVVLLHGGGGTAFAEWVKLWNDRGYAAIAMDLCGSVPVRDGADAKTWKRHGAGGPPGWDASFAQMGDAVADQWQYHALADMKLAHSLLRSLPGVDPNRTGLTGISWGGYLTGLAVGVDDRFKFAVPVYGCGFIDECVWAPTLEKMEPRQRQRWLDAWDPRHYLEGAKTPMLWVTGTNDFAYPFPALQKSYRLPEGERTLCVTLRMAHGHPPGQTPEVIHAYANAFVAGGTPLPKITGRGHDKETAWATFTSSTAVRSAELLYTRDNGPWQKRTWQSTPAKIGDDHRISAPVPADAKAYYLNLTDERGLTVSTEYEERP